MGTSPHFSPELTNPRLIFDSTGNFAQSEIQPVFRSFAKFPVKPNLYASISPTDEKSGLEHCNGFKYHCSIFSRLSPIYSGKVNNAIMAISPVSCVGVPLKMLIYSVYAVLYSHG